MLRAFAEADMRPSRYLRSYQHTILSHSAAAAPAVAAVSARFPAPRKPAATPLAASTGELFKAVAAVIGIIAGAEERADRT